MTADDPRPAGEEYATGGYVDPGARFMPDTTCYFPYRPAASGGATDGEREATHVVDRDGNVWTVVRDGGMATRADYRGVKSAGIAWLEREAGPLLPFDPVAYRRNYPRADR